MYLSTFEGSIDARGRVLVPSAFRAILGGAQKFYLYPAADGGGYLEGGGQELMEEYKSIFDNLPHGSMKRKAFVTVIFSKGGEIAMDQAGRASLPAHLLKAAGIEKDIVFVGAMDKFQIWNPERYAAFEAEMSDFAADNQDALEAPFYHVRGITPMGGQ